MPLPPVVTKINKNGVTFTSSVDRTQWTMEQLINAALRDVGNVLRMKMIYKLRTLKGFKKVRKKDRVLKSTMYRVDYKTNILKVGFKHNTWYGVQQELGTQNQPKRNILSETIQENIPLIIEIESQYLSSLTDEAKALRLAQESESTENNQEAEQDKLVL